MTGAVWVLPFLAGYALGFCTYAVLVYLEWRREAEWFERKWR